MRGDSSGSELELSLRAAAATTMRGDSSASELELSMRARELCALVDGADVVGAM